jgi:hypothetical protein
MPVLRVRISPPAFLRRGPLLRRSRTPRCPRGKVSSTVPRIAILPRVAKRLRRRSAKPIIVGSIPTARSYAGTVVSVAQWAYNPHRSGSILRAAPYAGVMQPGRHLWLKPGVLRVRFSPPALTFEMGMNAKRSRDRFFKPVLASSSLAIPARLWRSNPHGAGLVCGTSVREFDSLRSPFCSEVV